MIKMIQERLCASSYFLPHIDSVVLCKENHKQCSFADKQMACEYYEAAENDKEELEIKRVIYEV